MEYLSKERYDEIVAEVDYLINEEYPRIKEALAEARAQGGLEREFRVSRREAGSRKGDQQDPFSAESVTVLQSHRYQGVAEGPDFVVK